MRTGAAADDGAVDRSTAQALARGGALLSVISLVTPWYVLEAGSLRGVGKSGVAALGGWALVLAVLAVAATSSLLGRAHRLLPPLAGAALALLVLAKIASPPAPASAFGATSGDAAQAELEASLASVISDAVGLHYTPAWGIWLAAIGAGAALVGAIAAATRR
jgi:hypothetical protein